MQTPNLTLRIEMFGSLVEELKYWQSIGEDELGTSDDEIEYCEQKFDEVLFAIREYRVMLMEDLDNYVKDCKKDDIPVDLGYWRIKRQLKESTFDF